MTWHIKSTTKAIDGLYTYDVVQRLNDSRFGDSEHMGIASRILASGLQQWTAQTDRSYIYCDALALGCFRVDRRPAAHYATAL